VLCLPLTVLVAKSIGLYDRDELLLHKTTLEDIPALAQVATATTLLVWLLAPALIEGPLGRGQAVGLWALLIFVSAAARAVARKLAIRTAPTERCLLVAEPPVSLRITRRLEEGGAGGVAIVQRVELGDEQSLESVLSKIGRAIREEDVHRVILAPRALDGDAVLDAVQLSKALGAKVSLVPGVFEVVGSSVRFDDIGGMTVLGVPRFGLTRSSWLLKRGFDFTVAAVMLTALLPVLAVIAVAVRAESRGPVLFRQIRVGKDGRRFRMFKFRTMIDGADALKHDLRDRNEADGLFKIADDPRITRVGRFLRRTSLDELPQLVNVLRGEMSIVGPRPLVVDEDRKVEGWHRRRLHLMPGMTGHWQILGSARIPLDEMVKIDYLYVATWSLWNDVKILMRTIPYLLRARGM
jgi:exopolysaccharide biosynthesis polyprenyl glycosylphosphotransferase